MVKKRQVDESSSEAEEQYIVEVITKARVNDNGSWDYYVKWAGYDDEYNTWEPQENVQGCDRLLRGFWKDVGTDNDDYEEGFTVHATPSWIKKEKAFFKAHWGSGATNQEESSEEDQPGPSTKVIKQTPNKSETKSTKKERAGSTTSSKQNKKKSSKSKPTGEVLELDDSDETPLSLNKSSNTASTKKRPKKILIDSSGSDSLDIQPIRKKPKVGHSTDRNATEPSVSSDKSKGKAKETVPTVPKSTQDNLESSEAGGSLFTPPGSPYRSSPDVELVSTKPPPAAEPNPVKPPTIKIPATVQPSSKKVPTKAEPKRNVPTQPLPGQGSSISSGIPTKQRLAQRAKELTRPGLAGQRKSLSQLSFKKKSDAQPSSATSTPVQETHPMPLPAAVVVVESSNLRKSDSPRPIGTVLKAPQRVDSPMQIGDLPPPVTSSSAAAEPSLVQTRNPRRQPLPIPRRTAPALVPAPPLALPPPHNIQITEAEEFLASMMPAEMSAPMNEDVDESNTSVKVPVKSTSQAKASLGKILKKWRWQGELFVDVEPEKAHRLCNIALYDATDPRPQGLRFNICFLSVDSVRLRNMYDFADVYTILRGCTTVQQYARLGPQDEDDAIAVNAINAHLRKKNLFTYARVGLDGEEVAIMLVFPTSSEMAKFLQVPTALNEGTGLVAALIPWELTRSEYNKASWYNPRTIADTKTPDRKLAHNSDLKDAFRTTACQRALRLLKFPKSLLEFLTSSLSSSKRPYCLWYSPDGTPRNPDPETAALRVILNACQAIDVGYKADVRVIFVHVGALQSLYKLPALAERRCKHPQLRFYTYGSHEGVHPNRWGVRPIYPLGGIVTFSPSVIIENMFGVYDLIKKIDQHPLWQCYILPSTVAMVAKLTSQGVSPLELYDRIYERRGQFLHDGLLNLIHEGKMSLLRAPPLIRTPTPDSDPMMKWVGWQVKLLGLKPRGLLEECIKTALEQYPQIREKDLPEAIQKEILRDLWEMQMQPSMMDEYRRLVVIKGKGDSYLNEANKEVRDFRDGIECLALPSFDFKDDFFKK